MFPLRALVLFRFALFLLRFPFGKLLLSLLALEKGLYLREQDTGQSLYLVVGYPGAVVIGFLFSCHRAAPNLKLLLVEQIALKHSSIAEDEASPCILGNLFCGAGVVQNDTGQNIVSPAAYSEIYVVLDLTRNYICVRALGGKNEVDTKRPPQPRNRCKPALDLRQQLLVPFAPSRSVKYLWVVSRNFRKLVCSFWDE